MKRKIFAVMLVALLALTGCAGSKSQDKVLASVNGSDLTEAEFNQRYNIIAGQYNFDSENAEHAAYQEELKDQVLNSMIDEVLLLEEAANRGISISEEEMTVEMDMFKSSFSSEQEFQQYLSDYLKLSDSEFQELLRKDMIVSALYDEITGEIVSSTSSPREYFDNNREMFIAGAEVAATHILVETEEEAKEIISLLKEGADMNELAIERSIDPSAEFNGGDLGYFGRGRMVPEFEEVAFSMEVGELYPEPVKTEFGYHVIRLDDSHDEEDLQFSDVEEEITQYLIEEEKNTVFVDFINSLREKAEIKIS